VEEGDSDPSGREKLLVVKLGLVAEDVRVGVGGHGQAPLADELPDPRPRHSAQVEERDPAVTQVVYRGPPPGRVLRRRVGHAVRERLDELVAQVAIELGQHMLRQQPGGRVAFPKQH
jgi:hypothetical protein